MGWLSRIFGQTGKVRFKGVCTNGESFSGKTDIECFNISNSQLEEKLKELMYVETGKRVRSLTVTSFVEC